MGLVCPQLRLCLPSLELKPCQLLLHTKFGKKFGQLLQLWLCLPTLGLVCCQLWLCLFTQNLELHKLRLHLSSLETSDAHVWASIFLSTSLVLVLTKSALHQRFGCWSGLHWNLTELAEILGENLKEFDLSQMCT